MTVQIPTSLDACLCTTCENHNQRNEQKVFPLDPHLTSGDVHVDIHVETSMLTRFSN